MILTHAGKRLFKVYVNHPDIDRVEKLRRLADRIEEFDCRFWTPQIFCFLASPGPAPNLKVFRLHDGVQVPADEPRLELPKLFGGFLPSLRKLSLTSAIWPTGLFKALRSFKLGTSPRQVISPDHVLDALRESPSLETLHLVGTCLPPGDQPPPVALPSLMDCTLIGHGALSLVWYIDIPASANVFLSTPPLTSDATEVYPFRGRCLAPRLQALGKASTVSFSIGLDTIKLQVQTNSGGTLNVQMYYYKHVMSGLMTFVLLLYSPFYDLPCRFQTTKGFAVHIDQGAGCDDLESVHCAVLFLDFISDAPPLEQLELHGLSTKALSLFFRPLHECSKAVILFPNIRRLYIETTPLHSPKSLLEDLDKLLRGRMELGLPLESVDMRVNCEVLIPFAEHSAFLTSWGYLVEEDVRVEYLRNKAENLAGREVRICCLGLDIEKDEEDVEDKEEEEEAGVAESGGSDPDWESWISGQWPRAASDMKGPTGR